MTRLSGHDRSHELPLQGADILETENSAKFKPSRATIIAHPQANGNPRQAQTGAGARVLASVETL